MTYETEIRPTSKKQIKPCKYCGREVFWDNGSFKIKRPFLRNVSDGTLHQCGGRKDDPTK